MDDTQPPSPAPPPSAPSPRQRLQTLLAIPERERTDAQWDEINELEIMLAPGNREGAPDHNARRNNAPPMGHSHSNNPGGGGGGGKNGKNKRSGKKFHKRPSRGNPS